jgi:transcriptional regulator with XRE-family HTH domain
LATFGEIIAEKRRELGLSQRELAARILKEDGEPISGQYLNDLEKNRRNPPGAHLIKQFAEQLSIAADILFLAAGILPPDIRQANLRPEQAVEGFKAFRREMKKDE